MISDRRSLPLALIFCGLLAAEAPGQREMENLDRGLVAVRQADGKIYTGWRLFGTDPEKIAFNLYRVAGGEPQRVNAAPLDGSTNLVDADPGAATGYFVRPVTDGKEAEPGRQVEILNGNFIDIPIKRLDGYRPGDASTGDLDGDGRYDIVLHQTSNGKDNSFNGITGTPVLDGYKLDGTHLWRIDLGINIREGEHYTQFIVYDLDGDGRAEIACKTADGTVDGTGKIIGDKDKDWRSLRFP